MTESFPRAWATIDLRALKKNLSQVSVHSPEAQIMPVIKANAYGHGVEQVALALKSSHTKFAALAVASLEEAMERVAEGPSLELQVLDEEGRPLEARVEVLELRGRAGERWTARPRDGRYHRLLPESGRYTLRVRSKGLRTMRRRVEVGAGPHVEVITMRRRR